jgi:hypothetical protein
MTESPAELAHSRWHVAVHDPGEYWLLNNIDSNVCYVDLYDNMELLNYIAGALNFYEQHHKPEFTEHEHTANCRGYRSHYGMVEKI